MHDPVDARQGARHGRTVADVARLELDVRRQRVGAALAAVDLLDQTVEHPHAVAAAQQFGGEMATDEAGATGNEHRFRHEAWKLPCEDLKLCRSGIPSR